MIDPVHLFLIGLILITSATGIGVLIYMARMLGEARASTERVAASAERIAEMTREVLRRTS